MIGDVDGKSVLYKSSYILPSYIIKNEIFDVVSYNYTLRLLQCRMKWEIMYSVVLFLWISYNYTSCSVCPFFPFMSSICRSRVASQQGFVCVNASSPGRKSCRTAPHTHMCLRERIFAGEKERYFLTSLIPRVVSASRVRACVINRLVLLRRAACAVTCRVTRRKWRRHKRTFKNHTGSRVC